MSVRPHVLIIGSEGFIGRHMTACALQNGARVTGIGRRLKSACTDEHFQYHMCDALTGGELDEILEADPVQYVIHLAGEKNAARWDIFGPLFAANVQGTMHMLEAVRRACPMARVLVIGSAHEYGVVEDACMPLTEDKSGGATGPYGWSKRMQIDLARAYVDVYKMNIQIARTFNIVGPGANGGICAELAEQIVAVENGIQPPYIRVGDIRIERDFLDVRDAVNAYWQLLNASRVEIIYNVCSGKAISLAEIISIFQEAARIPFEIMTDSAWSRPHDTRVLYGSYEKLAQATGWKPRIHLAESLRMMLTERRDAARRDKTE